MLRLVADAQLVYAGTLACRFDKSELIVGENGRLYFPSPVPALGAYALVGAHLALKLGAELEL